jgi:DNA-binding transcriptional ArsR family regulator
MLEAVAARFRALADPGRLLLLQLLCAGARSVQELSELSGLSHANASKHLGLLGAAGFVLRRKEGTRAIYEVADDCPAELCDTVCRKVRRDAERALRAARAG